MSVIFDNLRFLLLGTFPEGPIGGLLLTLVLSIVVGLGSMLVGVSVAAAKLSLPNALSAVIQAMSIIVRSLPSLVFLFWLYFLLPAILNVPMTPFQSASIALSIYHGMFIAEDIRGGLQAVGKGQWEAGRSNGLSTTTIFFHIVLPQAVRAMVPALVNRYINLFLYTSVASVVGIVEFTRAAVLVNNRVLVHPLEIFGFAAFVYFLFGFGISRVGNYVERKWDWAPKVTDTSTAL